MFKRFVIVLMLMLLPFQWGVAQAHELNDDARELALTVATTGDQAASPLKSHQQEPGGTCQFHALAQPSAGCSAAGLALPLRQADLWSALYHASHQGRDRQHDIERPKWTRLAPFAAGSGQV